MLIANFSSSGEKSNVVLPKNQKLFITNSLAIDTSMKLVKNEYFGSDPSTYSHENPQDPDITRPQLLEHSTPQTHSHAPRFRKSCRDALE